MYLQIYLQSCEKQEPPLANSVCSNSSPLILHGIKFAPRLTSKILQIRLTVRIGEEGHSCQHQSHVGFHRAVWSEAKVSVDLCDPARTCRQPGGVFP
jgi:hypothetical protein